MEREMEYEDELKRKKRRRKRRRRFSPGRLFLLLIILAGLFAAAYGLIKKYMPNYTEIDFTEYYEDINDNGMSIVIGDERVPAGYIIEKRGVDVYLPVNFVMDYIDEYIFWDGAAQKLTVTTESKVMRYIPDSVAFYINGVEQKLDTPICEINNTAYMPIQLVQGLYPVLIYFSEETKTLVMDRAGTEMDIGVVSSKKTAMRYLPDIKSPVQRTLVSGTEVTVYGTEGSYTKIRTEDGLIGYILTKHLTISETRTLSPLGAEEEIRFPERGLISSGINMIWDQMENVTANSNENRRIVHDGLDVLSPTWFKFDSEALNGDIVSIADIDYVNWAHGQGYQVWALISDNFNSEVSHAVLSDTDTRAHVINQLMELIKEYRLDGINVDFENVPYADARCYVQFFRELAPYMKRAGAVLSVDMYVPTGGTAYYNRTEVGKAVDYVCVMAYDEHWSRDEESGPVASINFVTNGIANTILEVPREKVIMGMPYYVRVWREEHKDGNITRSISNKGMQYAFDIFIENGAKFVWDSDMGCYYGEYTAVEDGKTYLYRTWLEDERSIELKLRLVEEYGIAGIAGWRRGLEKPEIWGLLSKYLY